MVAFIRDGSADPNSRYAAAFRKGLNETGYVEGQNVTVEYHWMEGQFDRLPAAWPAGGAATYASLPAADGLFRVRMLSRGAGAAGQVKTA